MSIEALIQAHTEALLANTKAVLLLEASLVGRTPTAEKPKEAEKARGASPELAAVKEEKAAQKSSTDEAQEAIDKEQDEKVDAVPYETVRALVLKLAPTQRDAIKALNAKHGIANLKVLLDKEDDFSTVNDQVKLEAVYADLQALEA